MRTPTTSIALLVFLLAACGGNSVAPTSSDASLDRGGDPHFPRVLSNIAGTCSGTFIGPPVPPPPTFSQTDTGICNIRHLGRTTLYGEQVINFAAGTQSGWRTLTAANGDELHVQHSGTSGMIAPGVVRFQATMTIVGGTGRFANATGEMKAEGVATLATSSTEVSITSGTITY